MQSFVKKVLFGCLLIMVCGFMMPFRCSATLVKSDDTKVESICDDANQDGSSKVSDEGSSVQSIVANDGMSDLSKDAKVKVEESDVKSKTSSKGPTVCTDKARMQIVDSSSEELTLKESEDQCSDKMVLDLPKEESKVTIGIDGKLSKSDESIKKRGSMRLEKSDLESPKKKVSHKRSSSKIEIKRKRRSSMFSTLNLDLPENILSDVDGVIENPIKRKDVTLRVMAPASVDETPGKFKIRVMLDNNLENDIEDISLYMRFDDNSPELSLVAPVPVVENVKLMDKETYLYSVQVERVNEDVIRGFMVYVTHKAEDISLGEKREYLIAAYKQQVTLKKSPPNKAVIIIPGICGSELFSAKAQVVNGKQYSEGYRVWPPEGVMDFVENGNLLFTKTHTKVEFVKRLWNDVKLISCHKDGTSKAEMMIINPIMDCRNPGDRMFGTINSYGNLVASVLKSDYAKDAKVIFFSYDWRIGNEEIAKALKDFIRDNDFTDVVLIAHSMGGLVCSSFLSDPANCEKISKMIFLGTPFLGAAKAFNVLENGMFFGGIIGDIAGPVANPVICKIVKNMHSVYELLPPKQFFDIKMDQSYKGSVLDRGYLYTRKAKSKTFSSSYELRNYDQTVDVIIGREWTPAVQTFLAKAQKFHDSLYENGEMKFLKNGVPIYNIVGVNKDTHLGYYLTFGNDEMKCKEDLGNGDGTVTLISSTIFGNIPDDNTYYVNKVGHVDLTKNEASLQLVNNIIDDHDERFDPTVIVKSYPKKMSSESSCVIC